MNYLIAYFNLLPVQQLYFFSDNSRVESLSNAKQKIAITITAVSGRPHLVLFAYSLQAYCCVDVFLFGGSGIVPLSTTVSAEDQTLTNTADQQCNTVDRIRQGQQASWIVVTSVLRQESVFTSVCRICLCVCMFVCCGLLRQTRTEQATRYTSYIQSANNVSSRKLLRL